MRLLEALHRQLERLSRVAVYVGCGLLIACCGIVGVEVFARKVFAYSLLGADELTSYALAIALAWSLSFGLFARSHIRVDALYVHLPLVLRALLDIVSLTAFTTMAGFLVWRGWGVVAETIRLDARSSTPLGTPLVIPQSIWFAGLLFFLICLVTLLARTLAAFVRRDLAEVQRLAGAPSVQDEVEEELGEVEGERAVPSQVLANEPR